MCQLFQISNTTSLNRSNQIVSAFPLLACRIAKKSSSICSWQRGCRHGSIWSPCSSSSADDGTVAFLHTRHTSAYTRLACISPRVKSGGSAGGFLVTFVFCALRNMIQAAQSSKLSSSPADCPQILPCKALPRVSEFSTRPQPTPHRALRTERGTRQTSGCPPDLAPPRQPPPSLDSRQTWSSRHRRSGRARSECCRPAD